jgi:predicted nuclease with RNAse H fold
MIGKTMSNKGTIFIGVDLGTSTARKSTGIAYLVERNGKPVMESPPAHIKSEDELIHSCIIQMAENFSSKIIGIDASLSIPEHGTMRECERRLRKHGIACYPSGAEWVSKWVSKGIELKKWAENELGAKVIEVYPYAARRALNIGADVKKKTKEGRRNIQDGLLSLIGGLYALTKDKLLSDDELDAILSAYTAYCEGKGIASKIDGGDGVIYLPVKRHDHTIDEYTSLGDNFINPHPP